MKSRQFVPPLFVLLMLFGILFEVFVSKAWVMVALVAGSYLVANFTASFLTSAKRGWKHLPLLPLCFTILHFSYGSGFLIGLLKFWNRWGDKKGKVPEFGLDHG
jgi:hypothetical protein